MSDVFSVSHCTFRWFEWDENKRLINLDRHKIDFEDAATIFDAPYLFKRSDRGGEVRFLAIGLFEGIEIAVIYTERKEACRIISARRGRVNERKTYREAFP